MPNRQEPCKTDLDPGDKDDVCGVESQLRSTGPGVVDLRRNGREFKQWVGALFIKDAGEGGRHHYRLWLWLLSWGRRSRLGLGGSGGNCFLGFRAATNKNECRGN